MLCQQIWRDIIDAKYRRNDAEIRRAKDEREPRPEQCARPDEKRSKRSPTHNTSGSQSAFSLTLGVSTFHCRRYYSSPTRPLRRIFCAATYGLSPIPSTENTFHRTDRAIFSSKNPLVCHHASS